MVFWRLTIRTVKHRNTKNKLNDGSKKEGLKAYKDRKESKIESQKK